MCFLTKSDRRVAFAGGVLQARFGHKSLPPTDMVKLQIEESELAGGEIGYNR